MSTNNTQHAAVYQIVGAFIKVNGRFTHLDTISRVVQIQLNDPEQPHALMAWSDGNSYPAIMHRSSDRQEIEKRFKEVSSLVLKRKKRKFIHIDKLLFAKDMIANISSVVDEGRVLLSITPQIVDAKATWITYDTEEELDEALAKIEQQLAN
ncbi:hypothetical protein [Aeromonas caviae]|uniref:hypothetical protein n=1 Tax=Aeromonas caviae TaxID=648 RepID=UPI002B476074|nr:hypothetical protein [Aeromonas caviae]